MPTEFARKLSKIYNDVELAIDEYLNSQQELNDLKTQLEEDYASFAYTVHKKWTNDCKF